MGNDELEAYLRALQIEAGLGPMHAVHTGLGPKGRRSANPAHIFAAARPTCTDVLPPELATDARFDGGPPATVALASSPTKSSDTEEAKRKPECQKPRGGKRKNATGEPVEIVQPSTVEPKRALTVTEAVELYSISRSSLYNLIKSGILPDVVVAGRRLFPRDALEALISGKRP